MTCFNYGLQETRSKISLRYLGIYCILAFETLSSRALALDVFSTVAMATSTPTPARRRNFKELVLEAVEDADAVNHYRVSRQFIEAYVFGYFELGPGPELEKNETNRGHIKRAILRLVESGEIERVSGTGATGSFRPAKKSKKKPAPAASKKKPKTAAESKTGGASKKATK